MTLGPYEKMQELLEAFQKELRAELHEELQDQFFELKNEIACIVKQAIQDGFRKVHTHLKDDIVGSIQQLTFDQPVELRSFSPLEDGQFIARIALGKYCHLCGSKFKSNLYSKCSNCGNLRAVDILAIQ